MSGNKGMENVISIVNELMNVCTQTGLKWDLKLPQIAVIGFQSAGKSSVLESIVGRDFLPRGDGLVTRCPLILQLTTAEKEYGVFLHDTKRKKYENFDEIRSEIESQTELLIGPKKGISDEPINLQIFSPHVLDLTLVDIPGVTRISIGQTPKDIEAQSIKLIMEYITKENCLILAVTPANVDLAISDALKLAGQVDPDGNRTIGVITKCDLKGEGGVGNTDLRKILENEVFPLQRGFIGVVNRSEEATNENIQAALKREADFFANHKKLSDIAHRCGTPYLQKVLNRELTEHIRKSMPALREELQIKISELSIVVDEFKNWQSQDPNEMKNLIIKVAKNLDKNFKAEMGSFALDSVEMDGLSKGAEINEIFHKRLPEELEKIQYAEKISKDMVIHNTIQNYLGIETLVYPPQFAFVMVTKQQISKLKEPITLCIDLVIDKLIWAVKKCIKKIVYPNLRERLTKVVIEYIMNNKKSYMESILSLVDIEKSYLNTKQVNLNKKENSTLQEERFARQHLDKNMDNELHDVIMDIYDKAPKLLKMEAAEQAKYEKASKMLEACKTAMDAIDNLDAKAKASSAD